MCGISGYYSFDNSFLQEDLVKMTRKISHRGPDSEGFFMENQIALGHRRLSIIDLSEKANQPMTSENGRYVMVYNGEVYNYKNIQKQVKGIGTTHSDTRVILEAYSKLGDRFVEQLNGMFAIAIYDRESKSLQLWRDRIGIKPLYYFWDGINFAFSSELKSILELPIKKEINKEALKDYLFLEYIPEPNTIFKHIYKLEKGHSLKISEKKLTKKAYYNLLDKVNPAPSRFSENDYQEQLEQLLSDAVKKRTVSDVPIGAFLSGGTDSSLICSKFQEHSEVPINTFTIGFEEKSHDESGYAQSVAEYLKTNHHTSIIPAQNSLDWVNRINNHYDEPYAVSSVIPMLQVSQKASEKVKVAMSGDGGDELFMGYGYYFWSDRIKKVNQYGGHIARKVTANLLSLLGNKQKRAARVFNYEDTHRLWLHVWSQEQYMFNQKEIAKLLNEPYEHQTTFDDWKKINELDIPEYDKISLFDIRHYLANNLLHKVDIASMANGLEVRVPFLDHNLVEFAINLPNGQKIRDNEQKYILKKLLDKKLPSNLVYRKKWGFPAPMDHWLRKELSHLIEKHLSDSALVKTELFNPAFVNQLIHEFRNGKHYHHKRIWALIQFQLWHERYFQ